MTMPSTPSSPSPAPAPAATPPQSKGVAALIAGLIGILAAVLVGCMLLLGLWRHFGAKPTQQTATDAQTASADASAPPAAGATAPTAAATAPSATPAAPPATTPLTPAEVACAAANPLPSTFQCPAGRTCIAAICRRGSVCGTDMAADRFCAERLRVYETQPALNGGSFYSYLDGTTELRAADAPERWNMRDSAFVY